MDRFQILRGEAPPPEPPKPVIKYSGNSYRATEKESHRVGLLCVDSSGSLFSGVKCHFKEKYFKCKSVTMQAECCEKLGRPKWRVGSVLVKYNSDKKSKILDPYHYEIMPWFFGQLTFGMLKIMNDEFPLTKHDLVISCKNDAFQKVDIQPCEESLWQKFDELKTEILEAFPPVKEAMLKGLVVDLSDSEMKNLLNG